MSIDGKELASDILARTNARAGKLPHPPRVVAYVAPNPTPATKSYLGIKKESARAAGCVFEETENPASLMDADAAIVQLPASPEGMALLDQIPVEKDADVLSPIARTKFEQGESGALLPPVVGALAEIVKRYGISIRGKRAVVVGSGFLVGQPVATWLSQQLAYVSVIRNPSDTTIDLHDADIIVSGAGSPHFIKPEMIKHDVVLIDAGISELEGTLAGDVDPSCYPHASFFTPVPGGVGPIAVAKLFENAVVLAERKLSF